MRANSRTKLAVVAGILGLAALASGTAAGAAARPANMPQGANTVTLRVWTNGMPSEGMPSEGMPSEATPQDMPHP
jgi:ABC-type glycerol-3-phosphate transport system substrate-binding protein